MHEATAATERVILVGGGPGADDLITVRGLDQLMSADIVITDRLRCSAFPQAHREAAP